jgi:hypothetical protein
MHGKPRHIDIVVVSRMVGYTLDSVLSPVETLSDSSLAASPVLFRRSRQGRASRIFPGLESGECPVPLLAPRLTSHFLIGICNHTGNRPGPDMLAGKRSTGILGRPSKIQRKGPGRGADPLGEGGHVFCHPGWGQAARGLAGEYGGARRTPFRPPPAVVALMKDPADNRLPRGELAGLAADPTNRETKAGWDVKRDRHGDDRPTQPQAVSDSACAGRPEQRDRSVKRDGRRSVLADNAQLHGCPFSNLQKEMPPGTAAAYGLTCPKDRIKPAFGERLNRIAPLLDGPPRPLAQPWCLMHMAPCRRWIRPACLSGLHYPSFQSSTLRPDQMISFPWH